MSGRDHRIAHVVGSINRDIVAYVPHLARPGETVLSTRGALLPGGKGANQAVAIARLGGRCRMVGHIGADSFGADMTAFLAGENVDIAGVKQVAGAPTGFALISVDATSENCITVVPGANAEWPAGLPEFAVATNDIVVAQLEVPLSIVIAAFGRARAAGARTVLNPAPFQPLPDALMALTDILVLNETELMDLAGSKRAIVPTNDTELSGLLTPILALGPSSAIVTLGAAGVFLHQRGSAPVRLPGHTLAARDTTGAGDCFVGALVCELLRGQNTVAAARYANAAAALSVLRDGAAASFPNRAEVDQLLRKAAS